jgi:hypothetical protein
MKSLIELEALQPTGDLSPVSFKTVSSVHTDPPTILDCTSVLLSLDSNRNCEMVPRVLK